MKNVMVACAVVILALPGGCSLVLLRRPLDPATIHQIPPFAVQPVSDGTAVERFIVIGDMGMGLSGQRHVADRMAQRAEADGLDFLLTVGDNFYPDGVASASDPQWKTKFEDVYRHAELQVPVYATLGNHDHRANPFAQVDYAQRNPNWKMTGLYYTFTRVLTDGTDVQFFAIDTDPIVSERAGIAIQLHWLKRALAKSTARWKIAFGHHPLYGHNPRRGYNEAMIAHVGPLLTQYGVDAYFAGHDHTLEMIKPVGGVHHITSGAAGGPEIAYDVNWTDEGYYAATGGGFVLCRVTNDELLIEFVRMDGRTQYAHTIGK